MRDNEYHKISMQKPVYPHLVFCIEQLTFSADRIAIDMGCGSGRDTEYLLDNGFEVHAFDSNEQVISDLSKRFQIRLGRDLFLHVSKFSEFIYPKCVLINACSSLFFCEPRNFLNVWNSVKCALIPGGVFCGHFMGPEDSWAKQSHDRFTVHRRDEMIGLFSDFDIIDIYEINTPGTTLLGMQKHWHTFSVVAKKHV